MSSHILSSTKYIGCSAGPQRNEACVLEDTVVSAPVSKQALSFLRYECMDGNELWTDDAI